MEIEGGEIAVESDRPVGLPENFRDLSSLITSYHEAQGKISQLSERSQELEETLDAVLQAQEQEPAPPPVRPPQVDHLGLLQMFADRASQQAVAKIPPQGPFDIAATAHANRTTDLLAADPELRGIDVKRLVGDRVHEIPDEALGSPEVTAAALKALARDSQLNQLQSLAGLTQEVATAESRLMKLRSQSASGAAGRPQVSDGESDEDFAQELLEINRSGYAASRKW
jgi:hypothetical protein